MSYFEAPGRLLSPLARPNSSRAGGRCPIAVDKHEEEAAERHTIEHEGQEADATKQVHQESDRQDSGDEGQSSGQHLIVSDVTSALPIASPRVRTMAAPVAGMPSKKGEAGRVGPGEAQEARGRHGDAGAARTRNEGKRLRACQ